MGTMTRQEKILFTLIQLFFATLFFSKATSFNVAITGAIVLYSFTWTTLPEKFTLLKQRPYIVLMLLFLGYELISLAFSENTARGLHYLKIHLPLLLFPASLGLITLSRTFRDKILLGFAIITTIIGLACLLFSVYQYNQGPRSDIYYNDNLTMLLKRQSIYIAAAVNIAIFIFGYFIAFKRLAFKPLMLLAIGFLAVFSYLLASRVNLIILALATIGFSFHYIFSRKRIMEGIALVMGLFLAGFLIGKFFPATLNRYKELTFSKFNYENTGPESHFNVKATADQWNGANFRLAAWNCGWEVFKENPLSGTGIGDKEVALRKKYAEKNFHFALKTDKNVHNNYLDLLFSLGIVGLMIFLFAWLILPLWQALKFRDYLSVLIILTFALVWVSEVYFNRNFGAMIVGFFIPFLLADKFKTLSAASDQSDFSGSKP